MTYTSTRLALHITDALILDATHKQLRLEATDGQPLPIYEAGAHIDLFLPNGMVRQYSLMGQPKDRTSYLICVKKDPASRGGSRFIYDVLQQGTHIEASYPRNLFQLDDTRRAIFISAGIGITPLIAMAHAMAAKGRPYTMHHYARARVNMPVIEALCRDLDAHTMHVHVSEDGKSLRQGLPAELLTPDKDTILYLCGPNGFMTLFRQLALEAGWNGDGDDAQIRSEAFAASDVITPGISDANSLSFEVVLASDGKAYTVPKDKTIAQVLMDNGVSVPLSCEQGICGVCLTTVIDGIPDHRDDVQSDAEKARNDTIALCCSRSRTQRITIDL